MMLLEIPLINRWHCRHPNASARNKEWNWNITKSLWREKRHVATQLIQVLHKLLQTTAACCTDLVSFTSLFAPVWTITLGTVYLPCWLATTTSRRLYIPSRWKLNSYLPCFSSLCHYLVVNTAILLLAVELDKVLRWEFFERPDTK